MENTTRPIPDKNLLERMRSDADTIGIIHFGEHPRPTATHDSLMLMRLRAPHTADDAQWAKTFKILSENRGACDEVWFSTGVGFPKLDWHREHAVRLARYAEQLRGAGVVPSLQFQATIGHGDELTLQEDASGKTWGGFTGSGGVECKACNCPRQPAFLDYVREVARLYASFRPAWMWIDDDLRVNNHHPGSVGSDIGCWCPTCLAAFNDETGGHWTREALAAAIAEDAALHDAWLRFSVAGVAGVARAVAEATHEVSPGTRFGYQHGRWRLDAMIALFQALHEATGLPVGSRPGGGSYYDQDPNGLPVKAIQSAMQKKALGAPDWIDTWCPEVETWPRAFASRTAQGILVESLASLAYGMNAVSLLVMDTRSETDEWYSENLLAPLAAACGRVGRIGRSALPLRAHGRPRGAWHGAGLRNGRDGRPGGQPVRAHVEGDPRHPAAGGRTRRRAAARPRARPVRGARRAARGGGRQAQERDGAQCAHRRAEARDAGAAGRRARRDDRDMAGVPQSARHAPPAARERGDARDPARNLRLERRMAGAVDGGATG